MPLVSVFMPVYNAMPFLPEAVESIRAQTFGDWEMLIVDDGSTDGSWEFLQSVPDCRIRLLRQPHQGPAAASNLALAACRGEFAARMDADDLSHDTRLEEQVAFLRAHPEVGLVGTQFEYLGSTRRGWPSSLPLDHAPIMGDLRAGRHAMCNGTIVSRTELLRELGGYQAEGVLEDWAMFLRMGGRARIANLDRVLYWYRVHAASTNSRHIRELRERTGYVCEQARRELEKELPITFEQYLAQREGRPVWRRAVLAMENYGMVQYRGALNDVLGARRFRGYLRMALAAACSPRLTLQRVLRPFRKRADPYTNGHS